MRRIRKSELIDSAEEEKVTIRGVMDGKEETDDGGTVKDKK